jgi:hypothetical protein
VEAWNGKQVGSGVPEWALSNGKVEMNREVHIGDYALTFGKHKGRKLKNVPTGYLNWIMRRISSESFVATWLKHCEP